MLKAANVAVRAGLSLPPRDLPVLKRQDPKGKGKSAAALGLYQSLLGFMESVILQYLKGLIKKVERDFSQRHAVTGKGGMVLNQKEK